MSTTVFDEKTVQDLHKGKEVVDKSTPGNIPDWTNHCSHSGGRGWFVQFNGQDNGAVFRITPEEIKSLPTTVRMFKTREWTNFCELDEVEKANAIKKPTRSGDDLLHIALLYDDFDLWLGEEANQKAATSAKGGGK